MKSMDPIEKMLRKKLSSMHPAARERLHAQLFKQAEQQFSHPSMATSVLSFIFMTMKRYSPVYIGGLFAGVWALAALFNPVLTPEEVLAQVEEAYQEQLPEAFVYKHHTDFYSTENDERVLDSSLEFYSDDQGNQLQINWNALGKIETIFLTRVDDYGDVYDYIYNPYESFYLSQNTDENRSEELRGEKIYCFEPLESQYHQGQVLLKLSPDDYSVYELSGSSEPKGDVYVENPLDRMFELDGLENDRDYITQLIESQLYEYHYIQEGQQAYHLFEIPDVDGFSSFYIDAQTYRLVRYLRDEEHGHTELNIDYLPESERSTIFDPANYEGLVEISPAHSTDFPFDASVKGCFDFQGQPLAFDFFDTLPEKVRFEWNQMHESVYSGMMEDDRRLSNNPFAEDLDLPIDPSLLDPLSFVDVNAVLTQGFNSDHMGLDMASENPAFQDVYAVGRGTVVDVFDGAVEGEIQGEGGLQGNYILIQHTSSPHQLETFYAALGDIEVRVGDLVEPGQLIARMGNTGRSTGDHVHFEVRLDGEPIDPFSLFKIDLLAPDKPIIDSSETTSPEISDTNLDRTILDQAFGELFHDFTWALGYQPGHYALDFYAQEDEDADVLVVADGVVSFVSEDWNAGYGKMVIVSHRLNGVEIETLYAHLNDIQVTEGQILKKAEMIGHAGNSGRVELGGQGGVQLHFEVRSEGIKVDPFTIF